MASEVFHPRLRADQVSKQLRQSGTFSDRIVQWSGAEQREVCLLSWKALLPVSTLLWGQRVETISVDSRYTESQDKE